MKSQTNSKFKPQTRLLSDIMELLFCVIASRRRGNPGGGVLLSLNPEVASLQILNLKSQTNMVGGRKKLLVNLSNSPLTAEGQATKIAL